ncbi:MULTISPECIES: hypothetical protein [unclassified Synechococcus]|uniref:hypothetical protein n=1 Tax=unclassified Synechococcus TaxID=2626047 RepID=UPI0021A964B8|nr:MULTISPECIES: hypothetical protein [unclassified Synechococcus]MCT0212430.1 hypothetical protein [Synechococcus sp. CS-1326]MCT0234613.1 hypothetical protein [Synechococcus sp. CS-1327]
MGRERDPFRLPRAGWEVAPAAGLASIDLNGNHAAFGGGEFVSESTLGGVAVYAIYQALLTGLRTEALRQRGEIDRATQIQAIASTVWESVKQGAAVSAVLAVLLLVFPWLSLPLSLLGLVGMGKASLDLFHAFWDGLSDEQRPELHRAAHEAGLNLGQLFSGGANTQLQGS